MEQLLKLQDVCIAKTSNITQNSLSNENGEYPIYGASGLIKNIGFYQQDKEYIAIVKDGSGVGRVSLHPAYSSVIGTMQYIIPDNNIIDTKFLFHYLKHLNLSKYSVGMAIPHIYFKDYKNEALNVPSLEIQKEKSKTLDNLVKLIDIKEQILKKYDNLVKSQFIEMFENEKFENVNLENVCTKITDGSHNPPKGIDFSNYPMLSSQNINQQINFSNVRYLNEADFLRENKRTQVAKGDILVTIVGTIGRSVVVQDEIITLQRSVAVIKPNSNMNSYYINQYLKSETAQKQFSSKAHGSSQKGVYLGDLKKLQIPTPPIELQNQFADFVKHIDKLKFTLKEEIKKLQECYNSLMKEYFE